MLQIENLEVGYSGGAVLRGLNARIEDGQVVCVMGRNGVGKSTLLKSIMGLLRAIRGTVSWQNSDITKLATDKRSRAGIAYVPQGREIFPQMTVEENLLIGLEACDPKSFKRNQKQEIPDIAFDLFPMLGKMLHRKGGSLSGGQQQQLAIGRALVSNPKLLLLDEPMEGIQPSVVLEIEHAIQTLKKRRETAIVLVEQSLEFATGIADYSYILDKGRVVAEGNPEAMSSDVVRAHLTV